MTVTKYSRTDLLDSLVRFNEYYGRTPRTADLTPEKNMPSAHYYAKEFGSFTQALIAAGLCKPIDPCFWKELDSVQKCYYIGMIAGDGCVTDANMFTMDLCIVDIRWLDKLKEFMGFSCPVSVRDRYEQLNAVTCRVTQSITPWISDFAKYGVVQRKSGKERLPIEHCKDEASIAATILGYHDADFSIHQHGNSYRLNVLGPKHLCQQAIEVFEEYADVKPGKVPVNTPANNHLHEVQYAAKGDLERIYSFMYQSKDLAPHWLARKHEKWQQAVGVAV